MSDKKALERYGEILLKDEYKEFEGRSLKIRIPLYEKKFNIKIDFEEFSKIFINTQLNLIKTEIEISKKYIQDLIKNLKLKGLKIAVTTSARREKAEIILNLLGIKGELNSLLTSDDLNKHKPHPEPYIKILLKLKLKANECLIIEDSPSGIESGKKARIKVLALKTKTFLKSELKEADHIIYSLSDIDNFI